ARTPLRHLPEGGEGAFWLWALKPGAATAAPGFCVSPAPKSERHGRGADRGYSFVSTIHHTARGKAWPVMG
ncbi:hypothetical protein ACV34S_34565, partial [Pseudomonas aeruginosa]